MIAWHHEQSYRNSCVAACMCIVQKWRGEAPTEDAHHGAAPPGGNKLSRVLDVSKGRFAQLGNTEEEGLKAHLLDGGLVIAGVAGHPYVAWQERWYPELRSNFGPLCAPGSFDGPLHAIVLVRWVMRGYYLLDSWFPSEGQPLWISAEDFSSCFDGNTVLVDPA